MAEVISIVVMALVFAPVMMAAATRHSSHTPWCETYDEFLEWLESLGDKLPDAAYYLQGMISYAVGLGRLWHTHPVEPMMAAAPVGGDLLDKENRILSRLNLMKGDESRQPMAMGASNFGAATGWDGTILRQIFAFLQANPELVKFLLSLLKIT